MIPLTQNQPRATGEDAQTPTPLPTPYRFERNAQGGFTIWCDAGPVASSMVFNTEANRAKETFAFITLACNSYAADKARIAALVEALTDADALLYELGKACGEDALDQIDAMQRKIVAALAQAKQG